MKMIMRKRTIVMGCSEAATDMVDLLHDMGAGTSIKYVTAYIDGYKRRLMHIQFAADAVTYRYVLMTLRSSMDKKDFIMFG